MVQLEVRIDNLDNLDDPPYRVLREVPKLPMSPYPQGTSLREGIL